MTIFEQIQKNSAQLPPDKQIEVLDFISFLLQQTQPVAESESRKERAKGIKKSLDNLARMRVFADISDPVEWQRSLRKDRPLPGRES